MPQFIEYSKEPIIKSDLEKLCEFSLKELREFSIRNPSSKMAKIDPLAICLCQGAASYFINKGKGVKDFDIYFFYQYFYTRKIKPVDLGDIFEKFGVREEDWKRGFKGRRIDFCRRKIGRIEESVLIEKNLVNFLNESRTLTAKELTKKAIIGIWPEEIFGKVIWRGSQ